MNLKSLIPVGRSRMLAGSDTQPFGSLQRRWHRLDLFRVAIGEQVVSRVRATPGQPVDGLGQITQPGAVAGDAVLAGRHSGAE